VYFHQYIRTRKPCDGNFIKKDYELPDPTQYEAFYDIKTGMYLVYPKIGNIVTGVPTAMSPEEYKEYMLATQSKAYYKEKSDRYSLLFRKDKNDALRKGLIPSNHQKQAFETIFGSNKIEIIPSGFASFDFGGLVPENR
jgi:cell surface protein SprA